MSVRDIEIFRAVMSAGSTSKAANLLGISQPAVSQSIRKLENEAGLRLFERIRGRLLPTQEGMALMADVDRYFVGYETIMHRIRSLRSFGVGRLAIAIYPALGTTFIPRVLREFDARSRSVQVSLQLMSSREVYQQVLTGLADFGILADELSMSGLEHSIFCKLPAVAVMHRKHPLVKTPAITPADLACDDYLSLNPEDNSRRTVDSILLQNNVTLRPLIETPYSHSICELALQGIGMGIVNPVVALDYARQGLIIKPLTFNVEFSAVLALKSGRTLSENAKAFLRAMRIELKRVEDALRAAIASAGQPSVRGNGRERKKK